MKRLCFRLALLVGCAWVASAPGVYAAPQVPAQAVAPARLRALSGRYLGVPYRLDCLGEGAGPDKDPLFTRRFADCQTLVEQVMAEAIAPWTGGLDAAMRIIRYRDGKVRLENRHHYCVPDWLTYPWPARDVTAQIGGKHARAIDRRIDLPKLLAARGADPKLPDIGVRTVKTTYLPRARVAGVQAQIPDGTVVLFVLDRPDIVAGHVGFLFRQHGKVILRHASQTRKKVIDEPLLDHLARARRSVIGIKILQPDRAGLSRKPG